MMKVLTIVDVDDDSDDYVGDYDIKIMIMTTR